MLEPYLGRPYYFLWEGEKEWHDYLWHEGLSVDLSNDPVPVHVQYSAYNQRPHLNEISYLLVSGKPFQTHFLADSIELIEEVETDTFKLYKILDPSKLHPQQTMSGPGSNNKQVESHQIRARSINQQMLLEFELELAVDFIPEQQWQIVIEGAVDTVYIPLTKTRSKYEQILDLPGDEPYLDLTITVQADEILSKHQLNSYNIRALNPKH